MTAFNLEPRSIALTGAKWIHRLDIATYPEGFGRHVIGIAESLIYSLPRILLGSVVLALSLYVQIICIGVLTRLQPPQTPLVEFELSNLLNSISTIAANNVVLPIALVCALAGMAGFSLAVDRKLTELGSLWGYMVMIEMFGIVALGAGAGGLGPSLIRDFVHTAGGHLTLIIVAYAFLFEYGGGLIRLAAQELLPADSVGREWWDFQDHIHDASPIKMPALTVLKFGLLTIFEIVVCWALLFWLYFQVSSVFILLFFYPGWPLAAIFCLHRLNRRVERYRNARL